MSTTPGVSGSPFGVSVEPGSYRVTRPGSASEVIDLLQKHNIQIVDLKFTDLPGLWQHFSITLPEVHPDLFSAGIGFDGSSIRGFQEIHESDMLLRPDPATAFIDPVCSTPTLSIICDVVDPVLQQPYSRDPRYVAKKAENYLRQTGIATTCYFGPELEFYFPVPPSDTLQEIRSEIALTLQQAGVQIEVHHHEVATAGQNEIDMRFATLTRMADNVMIYKYVCKNVARRHGKVATFMPKPLFADNASGMHCHQSLWRDSENLFYDANGWALTSETCRWYIGGLLQHAPALMAFCAPTTNSYKRLVPGYEAPVNLAMSQRNRSAAARIPMYSSSPNARRVEFRCPDPSANAYLAFAAMLMAGLDGIENKTDPGDPLDRNIYDLSPEEAGNIRQVPGSLADALLALESDNAFLRKGDVFTEDVIQTWIEYKRTREIDTIKLRPHPWEFYLYFDT